MSRFKKLVPSDKPIIAMIHLPPLPDYEDSPGIEAVVESALHDLEILEHHRVDGVLIENEYDRPHKIVASKETVSAMIQVTKAVVSARRHCVVGCEILLNDPRASLDVAKAAGAEFIRVDYFVDRMARLEFGEFEIDPEGLISYRKKIDAQDILILADIQVKYANMLERRTLAQSAKLATDHQADAIVVSGDATGDAPAIKDLQDAKKASGVPVIIGSGLGHENARQLLARCDGAIVGTSLMKNRRVNADKVQRLLSALEWEQAR